MITAREIAEGRACPTCGGLPSGTGYMTAAGALYVLPEAGFVEVLSFGTLTEWEGRTFSSEEQAAAWLHGQWWRLLGALTSKAAALGRTPRMPETVEAEVVQEPNGVRVLRLRAETWWIG